ncbi:MAG TPA: hypothetical protein PLC53_02770, partial [Bacilli bacterium]|nr:hypothetical protein [Bacilli bacterium]
TTVEQLDELSKSTLGSKHIDKINIRKSQLKTSTSKSTKTLDELITKINNSKKGNEKLQVDYLTNEDIKLEDRLKRANVFDLGEGSNFSDDFKEFVKVWRELNTKEVSGEGVDKSKEGASSFSPTGDIESDQFITDVDPTQVAEKEPIAGINTFLSSVNQINIEEFDIIKTDVGIKIANSQLSEKFKKILSSDFNIGKPLYIKIDDEYIESKDENKDKELNLKVVDDEDTTLLHLNRNRYLENELILTDELTKGLDKLDEDKFKIFREELNTLHTSDVLSPDGYKQFTAFVNKWFGKDSLLLIEDNISTLSDFNITNIIEKLYRRVDYTTSQKLFDTKTNLSVWKQIIEQDLTGTKRLRNEVVERLDKGEERDKISIKTKLINKTNGSIVTTQKYHKVSETVGEYNKDYRLAIIPSYSSKSDLKDLRDIETEKSFDDLGIVSELNAGLIYLILTNTPTSRPSLIPLQARTINDTELTQVLGYTNDIINLINKNKDNNSFTRANKSLTDIIDKLSKIIYVNQDTNSTNKQFKINTSV